MSILTTSQLTFCDLKDSYSIYLSLDCIGLACDNSGQVLETQDISIKFRSLMGTTRVGLVCKSVTYLPQGVSLVSRTNATNAVDGEIKLRIQQGSTLSNQDVADIQVIFETTDTEKFTFEKYITFVKYMVGASGADAMNFKIYSADGLEFDDGSDTIELKTIAFKGSETITGTAYQWSWWNSESESYETITGATSYTLIVNRNDPYAFLNLRCVMTYDDKEYEDFVRLTDKTIVYTSLVKFFNGSNVFNDDDDYLAAYVELYKNNKLVETISATKYYAGNINAGAPGSYSNGDKMYFIYKEGDKYKVVLGEYQSGVWSPAADEAQYMYENDLYDDTLSNVIIISKTDINKSNVISFKIYKKVLIDDHGEYIRNDDTYVSSTNTYVVDLNDPVVHDTAPTSPYVGQLWLDTSVSPSILKMWDGEKWVKSGYQDGNVVYTSKPVNGYSRGDLWILADGETCGSFGSGSMLRATNDMSDIFRETDWEDAMKDATQTLQDVRQYFSFNANTGLKIGQRDEKFYVNIASQEMGFYYHDDDDSTPDQLLVSIGNDSSKIKNLVVEESAEFNCNSDVEFNCNATVNGQINIYNNSNAATGFAWKVEENGSFSLAILT